MGTGVSSEHIARAIDALAARVDAGEAWASDPLLVLSKLAEEVEGLRLGIYPLPENPRPLRDFLGVLPPLPDGELAEDCLARVHGDE
jgi:hypothetical protein